MALKLAKLFSEDDFKKCIESKWQIFISNRLDLTLFLVISRIKFLLLLIFLIKLSIQSIQVVKCFPSPAFGKSNTKIEYIFIDVLHNHV